MGIYYIASAASLIVCTIAVIAIVAVVKGYWVTECDRCDRDVSAADLDIDPDTGEAVCPYCRPSVPFDYGDDHERNGSITIQTTCSESFTRSPRQLASLIEGIHPTGGKYERRQ